MYTYIPSYFGFRYAFNIFNSPQIIYFVVWKISVDYIK